MADETSMHDFSQSDCRVNVVPLIDALRIADRLPRKARRRPNYRIHQRMMNRHQMQRDNLRTATAPNDRKAHGVMTN